MAYLALMDEVRTSGLPTVSLDPPQVVVAADVPALAAWWFAAMLTRLGWRGGTSPWVELHVSEP